MEAVFEFLGTLLCDEDLAAIFNGQTIDQKKAFVSNALNNAIDEIYPNNNFDIIIDVRDEDKQPA